MPVSAETSQQLFNAIIASKIYAGLQPDHYGRVIARIADDLGKDLSIREYVSLAFKEETFSNPESLLIEITRFLTRITELLQGEVTTEDQKKMSCVDALIPVEAKREVPEYKSLVVAALCGASAAADCAALDEGLGNASSIDFKFFFGISRIAAKFLLDRDLHFSDEGRTQFLAFLQCFYAFRSVDEKKCSDANVSDESSPFFTVYKQVFLPVLQGISEKITPKNLVVEEIKRRLREVIHINEGGTDETRNIAIRALKAVNDIFPTPSYDSAVITEDPLVQQFAAMENYRQLFSSKRSDSSFAMLAFNFASQGGERLDFFSKELPRAYSQGGGELGDLSDSKSALRSCVSLLGTVSRTLDDQVVCYDKQKRSRLEVLFPGEERRYTPGARGTYPADRGIVKTLAGIGMVAAMPLYGSGSPTSQAITFVHLLTVLGAFVDDRESPELRRLVQAASAIAVGTQKFVDALPKTPEGSDFGQDNTTIDDAKGEALAACSFYQAFSDLNADFIEGKLSVTDFRTQVAAAATNALDKFKGYLFSVKSANADDDVRRAAQQALSVMRDDEPENVLRESLSDLARSLKKDAEFANEIDPMKAVALLRTSPPDLELHQQLQWLDAVLTYQLDSSRENEGTRDLCEVITLVRWYRGLIPENFASISSSSDKMKCIMIANELSPALKPFFGQNVSEDDRETSKLLIERYALAIPPTSTQVLLLKTCMAECKAKSSQNFSSLSQDYVTNLEQVERETRGDMRFKVYVRDQVAPTLRKAGVYAEALACRRATIGTAPLAVRAKRVSVRLTQAASNVSLGWLPSIKYFIFRVTLFEFNAEKRVHKLRAELTEIESKLPATSGTGVSSTENASLESSTRLLHAKLALAEAKVAHRQAVEPHAKARTVSDVTEGTVEVSASSDGSKSYFSSGG